MNTATPAADLTREIDTLDRLLGRGQYYRAPGQRQTFAELVSVADELHDDVTWRDAK